MQRVNPTQRARRLGAACTVLAGIGLLVLALKVAGVLADDVASVIIAIIMALVIPISLAMAWVRDRSR